MRKLFLNKNFITIVSLIIILITFIGISYFNYSIAKNNCNGYFTSQNVFGIPIKTSCTYVVERGDK